MKMAGGILQMERSTGTTRDLRPMRMAGGILQMERLTGIILG